MGLFKPWVLGEIMAYKKYNAKKATFDGITFDSKAEMNRYCELKLLEKTKEISHLILQPEFLLLEGFRYKGKKIQSMKYIADFQYIEKDGTEVVEDVKGFKTKEYNIKKKLFLHKYGERFDFREIT